MGPDRRAELMQQCEGVFDNQYHRIMRKFYDSHITKEGGCDVAHSNRRFERLGHDLRVWDDLQVETRR